MADAGKMLVTTELTLDDVPALTVPANWPATISLRSRAADGPILMDRPPSALHSASP
jgi:hypothetical protein